MSKSNDIIHPSQNEWWELRETILCLLDVKSGLVRAFDIKNNDKRRCIYRKMNKKNTYENQFSEQERSALDFLIKLIQPMNYYPMCPRDIVTLQFKPDVTIVRGDKEGKLYNESFSDYKLYEEIVLIHKEDIVYELMFTNKLKNSFMNETYKFETIESVTYLKSGSMKDNCLRDLMVQTAASYLFSTENDNLKWRQNEIKKHPLLSKLGLCEKLQKNGDRRVVLNSIRKVVPPCFRQKGAKEWTSTQLNCPPLMPHVMYQNLNGDDLDDGKTHIDFVALRVVIRTFCLCHIISRGFVENISPLDAFPEIMELPVIHHIYRQLMEKELFRIVQREVIQFLSHIHKGFLRKNSYVIFE